MRAGTSRHLLILMVALLMTSCSSNTETGPGEVRWDREICERCSMSIGDRHYASQVRGGPKDGKAQLYKFDDIGCAVVWLDKQAWANNSSTEVWVADHRTGEWINARTAWYVMGRQTPMDYGLSAQSVKQDDALNFKQAVDAIHLKEDRQGKHHHVHVLPEIQQ